MFIKLYKVILISIISSMLMFGETIAFADTEGRVTGTNDGTGSYQKTNTYDIKENPQDDTALDIIVSFAIGIIGTRLLTYEKWTTDMMAAAASSGIYMAGAIMNIVQTKKEMQNLQLSLTFREDGKIDSNQVETIKKEKESWEKAKDSAERLKSLQEYAKIGFLISAGIATYLWMTNDGMLAACEAGLASASVAFKTCAATSSFVATETAACTYCGGLTTIMQKLLVAIKANDEAKALPSLSKELNDLENQTHASACYKTMCGGARAELIRTSMMVPACSAWAANHFKDKAFGVAKPVASSESNIEQMFLVNSGIKKSSESNKYKKFLKEAIEKIFPSSKAGMASLLGLGAGAAAALLLSQEHISTYLDTYMFSPGGRIIGWGALAFLTGLAADATQRKITNAQENIDKINSILAETSKLKQGMKVSNAVSSSINIATNLSPGFTDVVIPDGAKTGCLITANGSECASVVSAQAQLSSLSGLPQGLQDMITSTAQTADAITARGTLTGSTMNQAVTGSRNAAIKKFLGDQKVMLNKMLKENGKPEMNIDKDSSSLVRMIASDVGKSLMKNPADRSSLIASLGGGALGGDSSKDKPLEKSDDVVKKKGKTLFAAPPTVPGMKPAGGDFKLLDLPDAPADVLANGMKEGSASDKYDIKGNDIHKDSGVSIFEIVSKRYLKSGYPKLLEEDLKAK